VNSFERVKMRLRGEQVDQAPNFDIFMTFAAHFSGIKLRSYYLDHRALVSANLAVRQAFGVDVLQAISDPYRETHDLGAQIEFPEDDLPVCRQSLLAEQVDLQRLNRLDPSGGERMNDRLEAVRLMKERAAGEVAVMGWVEGALAEAADLRGVSRLLTDLADQEDWLEDLLEHCAQVEIAFAREQVSAGADIIGLGDALASQVSPRMYRQYALPYERRIFKAVHAMGALARLHICGNTSRILEDMAQSGADIIDVDWMVDLAQAARVFGRRAAVCGNFDPVAVMLRGTPQQVTGAVRLGLAQGGARGFSAAGCEIPDGTPVTNLLAQAQALDGV
jgi:MtaA/CmuA family methyltransferase